ncbi:MAG: DUF2807 domain-containing protein, partial [Gammaproteobacteria bacterium]|nr:DUF2807 domain-containing protein [Gammaproteobacteria bacterium]
MKRYLSIGLIFLSYLALVSCTAPTRYPTLNTDLTKETWMREVDTNPNKWTRGASRWFLTGDPSAAEKTIRHASYSEAVSTMSVRVPNFSNIKVNGDFQVQIFGTYGNNSVYVYGPNDGVRQAIVQVKGDTLCVDQVRKVSGSIRQVIVRIGVNQLNSLVQLGRGTVEGIQLRSNYLSVVSRGSGNVYLAGKMNLKSVINTGRGCISIFGANTPVLDIKTAGTGITNVSGNVGVRSIMHHGRTDINVIGANSDNLKIYADGRGKIGINGIVNLREIKAHNNVRIYAYNLSSTDLYAYVYDRVRVGLAGAAQNVYIDAFKASCVGARDLCAATAYVRAHHSAHINIAASDKIFAAATENSSVYFFGTPNIMSQHVNGNGTVIPIWSYRVKSCP